MAALVFDDALLTARAVFGADRKPLAARLGIAPIHPAAPAPANLPARVAALWPADLGPLWLNPSSESWLVALLREPPPEPLHVEVPAFLAADAAAALHGQGARCVLAGPVRGALAPEVQAAFFMAIHACGETGARSLPHVAMGCDCVGEANAALAAGARGVVGWPLGESPDGSARRKDIPTGVAVVMDLMQKVDREAPASELEDVLRRDPTLAYRLLRFINSPGFGLAVEVSSFQHALMLLGYARLKRWLALLLAGSVSDPDLQPLLFLAVLRGLYMEELARGQVDDAMRGELFICGVFSLLDRMLGQPFEHLLSSLPVPEGVHLALAGSSGPHRPWLEAAIAVEQGTAFDVRDAIDALMLSPGASNRALLHGLKAGWGMQAG